MQAKDISWLEFLTYAQLYHADTMHNMPKPTCYCPRFAYVRLYEKYPEKVVMAKFEKAMKKGYIDYGVSIVCPWLTDKGMETLISLQ
jgi:hypothetical protein